MGHTEPVTIDEILRQALALPREARARVAEEILHSLESDRGEAPANAEWEAAWAEELNRRAQEIDEGRARLIPADEVFAELTARFAPR